MILFPKIISAQDQDPKQELEQIKKRIADLEKQLSAKQNNENKTESIFNEGFWLVGKDDKIRIGGSAQIDGRLFLDREDGDSNFLIRRARIFVTGTLEDNFNYMMMGRWDQLTPTVHFAWLEAQHLSYARFRVGLFKEPFSLEGLHSDQHWDFVERSMIVSNFLQLEDIGAMLYGKFLEERVEYGVGVFNGRGRSADNNPDKEYVGRIVLAPFQKSVDILNDLYLGASISASEQSETLSGTTFKTGAGTEFWKWSGSTTVNDDKVRKGADLEWIYGPASVKAEYLQADWNDISKAAITEDFLSSGWFIQGSFLLTGENKRRNKPVLPKSNFDPAKGTWGAWEAAIRYEELKLEDDLITTGLATGTDKVKGFTIGINAYLNKHMMVKIDWQRLDFDDDITVGSHINDDESILFIRFQAEF
ncbi:MAG: hypothetical protein HY606_04000 [Planctomycetes bacterium]|nr:hypothetical protein [Planctomycetota bacterium]